MKLCPWSIAVVWCTTFGGMVTASEVRPPLTSAIEIRSLSTTEAEKGLKVVLQGTVTFFDDLNSVFMQDGTAGTFFSPVERGQLNPGDIVEVIGITKPGLYLPGILLPETEVTPFRVLGRGPLPEPITARYNDLISGRYHYQRVAIEGVVRSLATLRESSDGQEPPVPRGVMRVAVEGQVVEVRAETGAETKSGPPSVDSRVRVIGLAAGKINSRRQLVQPSVWIMDWSSVEVLEPAIPEKSIPLISSSDMMTFRITGPGDRRVRLTGVVTASLSNGLAFVRGERSAFGVRFFTPTSVTVGEHIEVVGFPEMDRFSANVVDAKLIERRSGEQPAPVELQIDESISGAHDGELVAVTAKVTDSFRTESGPAITLQRGGRALQVRGPMPGDGPLVGSVVRVVGICQVESSVGDRYNASPDAVIIRVRSAEDLTILEVPSSWTVQRMATILVVLIAAVLLAALWITLLRKQVARQTETLRVRISSEAALQERHRIAREFHDTLEQELAGLNLRLDAAATRVIDEKGRGLLAASRNLVGRIQVETRNLILDLRSSAEDAGDLGSALRELVDVHGGQPGVVVLLEPHDVLPTLPAATVHHVRMIAAEGVTNALKHSRATEIRVGVEAKTDVLVVRVTDNGVGFEVDANTVDKSGHFGCVGIRERCRKMGATVRWESQPGRGTVMELSVPWTADTRAYPPGNREPVAEPVV